MLSIEKIIDSVEIAATEFPIKKQNYSAHTLQGAIALTVTWICWSSSARLGSPF